MEQTLFDLFAENFGVTFAVIAMASGAIMAGLIWCTIYLVKIKTKHREISQRIETFPCESHSKLIERQSERLVGLDRTISELNGTVKTLIGVYAAVPTRSSSVILGVDVPEMAQRHSPKVLNDNGEKVSRLFGCGEFLTNNKEWLSQRLSEMKPKNALDVEMYALAVLRLASTDERFNTLKNKIFISPKIGLTDQEGNLRQIEITLDDVLFVISLGLRDDFLLKHPELNP